MTYTAHREAAAIALRTGWTPNEVLNTDPLILDEVLDLLDKRDEQERRESMRNRLRSKMKG